MVAMFCKLHLKFHWHSFISLQVKVQKYAILSVYMLYFWDVTKMRVWTRKRIEPISLECFLYHCTIVLAAYKSLQQ